MPGTWFPDGGHRLLGRHIAATAHLVGTRIPATAFRLRKSNGLGRQRGSPDQTSIYITEHRFKSFRPQSIDSIVKQHTLNRTPARRVVMVRWRSHTLGHRGRFQHMSRSNPEASDKIPVRSGNVTAQCPSPRCRSLQHALCIDNSQQANPVQALKHITWVLPDVWTGSVDQVGPM